MEAQSLAGQQLSRQTGERLVDERQRLGRSIWLLLLLWSWSPGAGSFVRSGESVLAEALAQGLGIGERQARRDLHRLRRAGYVELWNTGRGYKIRVTSGPEILSAGGTR